MNAASLSPEARRWLRFAHEDLAAAEALLDRVDVAPRQACWLAQQVAEKALKALKAVLVFLELDFPWTHNLDVLRNLIPEGWKVKEQHPELGELSGWAVQARYPGDWPDADQTDARSAVEQARAVWASVSADFAQRGVTVEE